MLLGWWQWYRLSERQKRRAKRDRSWKEEEGCVPHLGCHMDQGLSTLAKLGLMDPMRLGNTHLCFSRRTKSSYTAELFAVCIFNLFSLFHL